MATTTIIPGNVYVTTGTISGDVITHTSKNLVKIHSSRIEYSYINNLINPGVFKDPGDRTEVLGRIIIDLKDIKKVITVTGFLDDEPAVSGNTKRNNLLDMGENQGELTLVWGTGNYRTIFIPKHNLNPPQFGVFILKQLFTESAGIAGSAVSGDPQPLRKINVVAAFLVGEDTANV